jgi:hypothetical protein
MPPNNQDPLEVLQLTDLLEKTIDSFIKNLTPHEWDEDFITRGLLKHLRSSLSGIKLKGKDYRKNIKWEPYKLTGNPETKFGDIALVVNISYKDGTNINGAAFLEAKIRYREETTFDAMKDTQAKRILTNAPRAQYLLYDYEDITNFLDIPSEIRFFDYRRSAFVPFIPKTRSVCVPLNLADSSGIEDTLLYRYGTPLSFMLACRYFQGLDLEFDDISKKVATGYLEQFGKPRYILKIDITEEGAEQMGSELTVNQDNYTQI